MLIEVIKLYFVILVLLSMTLIQARSQEYQKAKNSSSAISQSAQSIWMECGILLRQVGAINLKLI